jgi:hypothetical protein
LSIVGADEWTNGQQIDEQMGRNYVASNPKEERLEVGVHA